MSENMKMYVWETDEYGQDHFVVVAENKEESMRLIDDKIKSDESVSAHKWRTDNYKSTVMELGEVVNFFYT